ncbi:hypothetical protein SO802_021387 [Lithocarpus litseifolius]|uniref:Uncharacterized protein n=1 Tax=Lithocarpus litseifolius TaxID=425828 RepID=A0AAW2CG35_9ROSI
MGSHLTKLEEAKLEKTTRVEIPDDEEVEDWEERNKADYERNKQFEKLRVETIAMRKKMEKMQLAFRKNWVQIDEIEWDCSKLIETIEVNVVEVQGVWDEEEEILKNSVAV